MKTGGEKMKPKNGKLGEGYWLKNGAKITRVFHKAYEQKKERASDIEELLFLTQRFSLCILQENCLNAAIRLGWDGFSCRRCLINGNPNFIAQLKDLKGRIPFEI